MRHLWRMTLWGATAASALLVAVLTSRSEVGAERASLALGSLRGHSHLAAAHPADMQAETRRLSEAVRGLAAQDDQIKSRLAVIEQNVDSITGSVKKQIEAAKAEKPDPWPADVAPVATAPAVIASIITSGGPSPAQLHAPLPQIQSVAPAAPAPAEPVAAIPAAADPVSAEPAPNDATPADYGVDIGSALSVQVLRARWLGIRSAHEKLFAGLTPTAMVRDIPQTKNVELRLVVGPLPSSEAAAHLCSALAPYHLFCKPTAFDRHRVALQ